MRELLASCGQLGKGMLEHWKLAVSGCISSLLGWVLPAFDVKTITARTLWWVGIVLLGWAAVRTFHDLRLERDRLATRLQPRLSIVLGGQIRPFLQTDTLHMMRE